MYASGSSLKIGVRPRLTSTRIRSALLFMLVGAGVATQAACGGGGAKPSSERMSMRPLGSIVGAPQGYVEYLPPGYGDDAKRPLLIFLHGSGSNGPGTKASLEDVFGTGLPDLIRNDEWPAARPFIVLMPQHVDPTNETCPSGEEVAEFLEFAMKHYDVDPTRVYLTGLSCGGIGIWNYLALYTDRVVAGAVPIAGDGRLALSFAGCDLGKVPIWALHGSADAVVDPQGSIQTMHELETCTDPKPIEPRLTVYPGVGHNSWDRTYDLSADNDIYAWLLSHQHA
jgi:predicted peptidase